MSDNPGAERASPIEWRKTSGRTHLVLMPPMKREARKIKTAHQALDDFCDHLKRVNARCMRAALVNSLASTEPSWRRIWRRASEIVTRRVSRG